MIQRADRPFLGIWRGNREFTELRRGSRVLWQKDVPEEPKEKLTTLTLTAASNADLALLDFVLWAIGQGHTGHVTATIGGEVHSLGGVAPLLSVRSEVSGNDGRTATLSIGEESALNVESLRVGEAISVELVLEAGGPYKSEDGQNWNAFYLPATVSEGLVEVSAMPCLLPDSRWVKLSCDADCIDGSLLNPTTSLKRTVTIKLNEVVMGTASCVITSGITWCTAWTYSVPESKLNTVLATTDKRPLSLTVTNMPTGYFNSIYWNWDKIDTVLTLIVTTNADENML